MVAVTGIIFHRNGGKVNGILGRPPAVFAVNRWRRARKNAYPTSPFSGCNGRRMVKVLPPPAAPETSIVPP